MKIKAEGQNITIAHEGDVEPMIVPVQELLDVIAEKFPQKVLDTAEFMKGNPK